MSISQNLDQVRSLIASACQKSAAVNGRRAARGRLED